MQIAAIIVSLVLAVVGVALFARAFLQIHGFVRLGQNVPAGSRTNDWKNRTVTVVREFLGHTRMNKWGVVGVAHWFVAIGFFTLVLTVVNALGQLFQADWLLPVIGDWALYGAFVDFIGVMTTLGILTLIVIRQLSHPRRPDRKSRFAGSNFGQAYFVEAVILIVGFCIYTMHALEGALHGVDGYQAAYFLSYPLVAAFKGLSVATLQTLVYLFAMIKLATTFTWMITVSLKTDMGVAWHRFLAFPNIWFKRNATGDVALGALLPMTSGGRPIDFEDPAEDAVFGASQVEHFSWKGILDFSTCT
ncbi:Fe-S oxidoreductase, partial [Saccharothrix sp. ST-888]